MNCPARLPCSRRTGQIHCSCSVDMSFFCVALHSSSYSLRNLRILHPAACCARHRDHEEFLAFSLAMPATSRPGALPRSRYSRSLGVVILNCCTSVDDSMHRGDCQCPSCPEEHRAKAENAARRGAAARARKAIRRHGVGRRGATSRRRLDHLIALSSKTLIFLSISPGNSRAASVRNIVFIVLSSMLLSVLRASERP